MILRRWSSFGSSASTLIHLLTGSSPLVDRLSLTGSLATAIEPWLEDATRRRLVVPVGDAVDGALRLARAMAESASDHTCAA
jgi:N-acetylglucosamine kinase-like BadF-type ATPase